MSGVKKIKKIKKIVKIKKTKKTVARKSFTTIKGRKLTRGKSRYKEGWHKTWDGKRVYLRSGEELKYAKKLDKQKLIYEVETISYFYFDTTEQKVKKGYIDFYIPEQNLIVEIKGGHLLDEQNIKDRLVILESRGYNYKLIVNGKEHKL